jgi:DNA-binding CsgD family transcriptional regulator
MPEDESKNLFPLGAGHISSINWVFDPVIRIDTSPVAGIASSDVLISNRILISTLDCIQDGVCILDPELNLRYINNSIKYWYSVADGSLNQKCYQVYHNQDEPCENCPILNTIEDHAPHFGIAKYSIGGVDKGWQQLFAIPILNDHEELIGIVEYVRDITVQYQLEQDLTRIMEQFQSLEKRNAAITQLLAQRKLEREQLEETISQNFEKFIKPSLKYLKSKSNESEVSLVETLIEEIVYPISKKRSSLLDNLSSREKQIALMIKEGKTSAEIARALTLSQKTIDFHRANIRKKLGLESDDSGFINLESYLNTHS